MTTITFDTLELVDKLKTAGIPQEQAEAVVRVIAEAQDSLVTKEFLTSSLKTEMADLRVDLFKWTAGALLAQAALISALIKIF